MSTPSERFFYSPKLDVGPLFRQDVEDPSLPPELARPCQENQSCLDTDELDYYHELNTKADTRACRLVAPIGALSGLVLLNMVTIQLDDEGDVDLNRTGEPQPAMLSL
ncbi:hypothetical protein EC957_002604 [Mortierella hygrophila]|uniref:Uncharacterized protein n=1 Tax=Mortierella hygrophila TaxID=979708 RepID=A0A9P6F4P5_9FUNG|nr:hypothetical protein EC957_002604 [Mortierella hygrophila]